MLHLSKALETNECIHTLNLNGTYVFMSHFNICHLMYSIYIDIDNEIGDKGLQYLACALETNSALHTIYLQSKCHLFDSIPLIVSI